MKGPSKALLSIEGIRAMYEYTLGIVLSTPLKYISPKGDGHPVIVIPGLGTSDGSTTYIRNFLSDLGYESHSWGMGRNIGPRKGLDALLEQLTKRIDTVYEESGNQQISLIGWSLGGIYAREIAKLVPDKIRQVITLGTPFKGDAGGTNAAFLYEILSKDKSHKNPDVIKTIGVPPPVPFTSIYSKTDGIVHWQCSIEDLSDISENVEIPGASHLGLGHNPISLFVVANRLTQSRENWQPYNR
jgi:pimeloyl-ACP methyl ester carboxylesterase